MRVSGAVVIAVVLIGCKSDTKKSDKPVPTASGSAGSAGDTAGSGSANDDEATAVEPDTGSGAGSAARPAGPLKPTVDLTLTGAVTAKLVGTAGTCSCHDDSANITIRSDDLKVQPSLELNVLVTEAAEWNDPALVINVKAPQRGSFGRNRVRHGPDDKLSVAKDCSQATFEHVVLKGVATKGDVTVTGTITCAP
jgi:hypothetical protein